MDRVGDAVSFIVGTYTIAGAFLRRTLCGGVSTALSGRTACGLAGKQRRSRVVVLALVDLTRQLSNLRGEVQRLLDTENST